ncbi:hypothetical protein [Maribacter sp. ACAM166]|uniref:hypothetical protein n=1 Tax=Maribacter sp. ACAM166 TaxID=2508996 RepID=UPI001484E733|nr:hypothetical protein [Maribacter sp. ACAM166]
MEYNWELYDMSKDRSETNNIVTVLPDKAMELETLWNIWANKTEVLNWTTKKPFN